MKKMLCLLTALLLLASSASLAQEEPLYPEGYDLLLVTDIFTNNDDELYAEKTEVELRSAPEHTALQGTLGALAVGANPDDDAALIGFGRDESSIYTFGLAEDCVILLPADPLDPTQIVQIDDLQAWYDQACAVMADYFEEGQTRYEFYATFALDDTGCLTKLEYQYFDWQ